MWIFLIVSTVAWGLAEIFYKKGNIEQEKYSHLKTTVYVGFLMGAYALVMLFVGKVDLKSFPSNFLRYLPVAICYIISMVCSYFGVRFIEESIADPIENTSGAFVAILCAIFLKEKLNFPSILAIFLIIIGLISIGIFDKTDKKTRTEKFGKRIAFFSIAMPFCYMMLDAAGTFLDIFYTEDAASSFLVNVNDANIEHTANCAYELTFFLFAICILIFLKCKKVKLIDFHDKNSGNTVKFKVLAASFETIGQATYLFALTSGSGIAAAILGSGTVLISLVLSAIFLKERLNIFQYIFIGVIVCGIVLLSVFGI